MSWFEEAKRIAANTVLVMENTDEQTAAMRQNICITCDQMDHEKKQCTICGCYIANKTWSKYSRSKNRPFGEITHCPLGKWGDTDIANYYRAEDGLPPLDEESPRKGPDTADHFTY